MSAYRYTLTRSWAYGTGRVCWVMLNPSTADEREDDPTIRRCIRFSQDHGYAELVVVNLFAVRATNPKELDPVSHDIRGPGNREALYQAVATSRAVVCAWGASVPRPAKAMAAGAAEFVRLVAVERGRPLLCLGTTKTGAPRHPLYVAAATSFEGYSKEVTE